MTGRRASAPVAYALFGLAIAECAVWMIGVGVTGMSFAAARDSFMISNTVIGFGCAVCGVLIASQRPDNRLGWLLLGAGVTQNGTAAVSPWLVDALGSAAGIESVRALATIYSLCWPLSVSVFIPLALLHFPTGRLAGRGWRGVAAVIVINGLLQVLLFSGDPDPLAPVRELGPETRGRAASYLQIPGLGLNGTLDLISNLVLATSYAVCLVSLIIRYRRGDERTRRQLLWLMLAATVSTGVVLGDRLIAVGESFPILLTAVVALVPVAMTIAVLRHQLLDIRWVWSRALTYGLLTGAVVAAYLLLVAVADWLIRPEVGVGVSVVVTLLIAAAFNPARLWVQRRVERLMYGGRADPVRAAATVTTQLAALGDHPADILPALCAALRLPYARLTDADGTVAEHGERPAHVESIVLQHGDEPVGTLEVGARSGERRLDRADRAVLELMAVPIGVAMRAGALSESLQSSRRDVISAREEERRRIRRDLHDGLGPLLTGVAFQADAVVALAESDPDRVRGLGEEIRTGVTTAITDVRSLVNQLHPSALDDLGLVEAVRRNAQHWDRRHDGEPLVVEVRADPSLPDLSAVLEVTAYRIVTEALTNVARHSSASSARVDIAVPPDAPEVLLVRIDDDGRGATPWDPGVGLRSMRERAAELGGTVCAEPTPSGGRVTARLPIEASR